MYSLTEAFIELNKLDEGFKTLDGHYAYDPKGKNVDANGKEYHGHVATNQPMLEAALRNHELVYPLISKEDYFKLAMELAQEDCADANLTTTRSGIIGFAGTKDVDWGSDFTYKIRFKSNIINKAALEQIYKNKFLAKMVFDAYIDTFGGEDFCDVVIIRNDEKKLTSDPNIMTCYPATRSSVENLIKKCNIYNNEKATADTNVKQQMLVLLDPNQKDVVKFRVVKPTSISSSTKVRDSGVDNMTKYNKGVYIANNGNIHEFKVADNINKQLKTASGDAYALSSRATGVAKDTFKLAAAKEIFNNEKTITDNFRQKYVKDLIEVWASTPGDACNFIDNEPKIRELIEHVYGVKEIDDYRGFQNILKKIDYDVYKQWQRLENEE